MTVTRSWGIVVAFNNSDHSSAGLYQGGMRSLGTAGAILIDQGNADDVSSMPAFKVVSGAITISASGVATLQDPELVAIAGLTSAADKGIMFSGAGTAATYDLSSFARTLLDDANASAARSTLGLAIGTDVQAYSAKLADLTGISFAQGDVLYWNGTHLVSLAAGTSGQFLKTQGSSANPVWDSIAGGGDMLASNNLSDLSSAQAARANLGLVVRPQGRLTLTSATPVLTSDVTAATSVYYALYEGQLVPIYDGSKFVPTAFTELTLALDGSSGHTGYHQSGKNFDLFVINDSGTIRLVTGPAWSSDTSRGTGAGTTELQRVAGLPTNKNSMTARFGSSSGNTVSVAANQATYVGTFRASADGQTQVKLGLSAAAGGGEVWLGLWNLYNRVNHGAVVRDSSSWTYNSGTWRSADGSAANRISAVRGLDEDSVAARFEYSASSGAGGDIQLGVALDSTTTASGTIPYVFAAGNNSVASAAYGGMPGLGFHYLQAIEHQVTTSNAISVNANSASLSAVLRY